MLKTLQRDDGRNGELEQALRTTTLIVDDHYCQTAIGMLGLARGEVRLCAYAWRWYVNEPELEVQKLNIQLYSLRRHGVRIRCLVDTEAMSKTFATLGFNVRSVVNTRMLHTKAISVDDKSLIIGSHNLTKRANSDNYEMSLLTHEYQAVAAFNDYFDRLWLSRG